MKKLLLGILAISSVSSYAKCLVSLPYSDSTLRSFFTDDTYTPFTTLDKFAEKRGISIVKKEDAKITIGKFYKESNRRSLLCGDTNIQYEILTVNGLEFEGDVFRSNNCESQQRGFAATAAARKAIKYISEEFNCKDNQEFEEVSTDYSVSHYYYNCEIEHRVSDSSYYLRAQRPNCYWNYDDSSTKRVCERPAIYSKDKQMDHSSYQYGFLAFTSEVNAKKSAIKKALKICHEVSIDGVQL